MHHVPGPLFQISVAHFLKCHDQARHDFFERPFGIDRLCLNGIDGSAVKHFIFQQCDVGFEDIIARQFFRAVFEDGLKFIPGSFHGGLESFDLRLQLCFLDIILFNDIHPFFIHQISLADTYPGGGIDSLKYYFLKSGF